MAHSHGDGHHPAHMSDGRLLAAVAINVLLTVAQVVGGLLSGSLSLVADALHNFSDAGSLMLALIARRIGRRPADRRRTFGYKRAETIGALINLTTLIIVGVYLLYEAGRRYFDPQPIEGWTVIIVAAIALVIDIATAALTYSMSKGSLNIRAAFLHNVSDALASIAVIVAGTLILLYGWFIVDLIATCLISAYVIYQGFTNMRGAIRILMDSAPPGVDVDEIRRNLEEIDGVLGVHHVHLWQIDEAESTLQAHVIIRRADADRLEGIKQAIKARLAAHHRIRQSTLEFEFPQEAGGTPHDLSLIAKRPAN